MAAPAPVEEPEIDPTPEALEHLGRVITQLGRQPAGRALRDELRHMDADARVEFALDLLPLPVDEACEEAVAKVAGIRVRRTRAMMAAERARGAAVTTREYDGRDLVSLDDAPADDVPTPTATEAGPYAVTTEEPADAIPTPGFDHYETSTGPNGQRLSVYLPADPTRPGRSRPRTHAAPTTPTAGATATVQPEAIGAGLGGLLHSIQASRQAALSNVADAFPDGAAGIEAALAQVSPALAAQLTGARAAASSPTAPVATVPVGTPVLEPAAMQRMFAVLPLLTPAEQMVAPTIASSLPADKRALLMAKLVAVPLAQAVEIVKDIIATHAAHGSPHR